MVKQIVNAAPMVIDYGTQDLSTRTLPREAELIPQHLPKFYLFTQKGNKTPKLVVGNERNIAFGIDSFDLRKKYANHATVFANGVNAQGNAQMIQRLIPDDAGPEANMILWLDVLPTTVDLYARNADGSLQLDINGDPIVNGTTPGYRIKWVMSHRPTILDMANFGSASIIAGDQVDPLTLVNSQRYPIFEFKTSFQGEYGNTCGIRMWALTNEGNNGLPTKMMSQYKAYPYMISQIRKPDPLASAYEVETIFGEQRIMMTLKKDVLDPLTDKQLYIEDTFISSYENLTDLRYPTVEGDFSDVFVYYDNLETLLALFHTSEVPFIDPAYSDITSDVDTMHLINVITGVSSFNAPYHSIVYNDSLNTIRFSELTNVFPLGGSDGTINDTVHADLVEVELARYADPNDEVQELALNVESIFYDSGYRLSTKLAAADFISQRRDTFVVLGTHDVNDRILTASEEHSIAIALRTRLQMFPESDYFGTPVMRGMIIGRSAKIRNSQYTKYLPMTYEVAIKAAKYMGAGDGRWKNGSHFDGAPGSIIESMYDINITWVPTDVRNRNWDVGLNWVQHYDRRSFFFPALKTVYDNDTSVLNSFNTAMAICQLNKIAHAAWREFSGVDHLTNAQLVTRVNDFVNDRVKGRFDNRFVIQPDAFFTELDVLRGFSWTLPIKIYAPNMKTVMTTYVKAYRIEDLATNQ